VIGPRTKISSGKSEIIILKKRRIILGGFNPILKWFPEFDSRTDSTSQHNWDEERLLFETVKEERSI